MSVSGDKQPIQNRTNTDTEPIQIEQTTQKGSEKSSKKGSEKSSKKTRDRIVCEMRENPSVTINDLATMLSISDRAVSKHLKKLQEEDIIKRVGADPGGYWEVIDRSS